MDPRLLNVLTGEISQGFANLLLGQHVVPNPERAGAEVDWRIFEERFGMGRIGSEGGGGEREGQGDEEKKAAQEKLVHEADE